METNIKRIKLYIIGIVAFVLLLWFLNHKATAQCMVVSTNGYTVNMSVVPEQIIPNSTVCSNGYNFNYKLRYDITFSGINIPSSLYTLQGNVLASGYSKNFFDLPNNGGSGTVISGGNSYTSRTDCNTATVGSFNPSIEIQIHGPGISNRTISCPIAALPVQLVSFTGQNIQEGILLNWSTASEVNNDYFAVERSSDAYTWQTLSIIQGKGNSSVVMNYSYNDEQPLTGVNYYRLRQTDLDGRMAYSKIVKVEEVGTTIETTVYPNPTASSNVSVRIESSSRESIEIEIFDSIGQKLKSYQLESSSAMINYELALPETGNVFMLTIIQANKVIGKHQVLVR